MLMRIDYVVTHSQSLQKMILCANKPRRLKYKIIFNQENQL